MVYKALYDQFKPKKTTNDLRAQQRGILGGIAGMVGAIASNAFECRYIREVGDLGRQPKFLRQSYSYNNFAGLKYNMAKAFMFNYLMLYPYEILKENCYNVFGDVWVNSPLAILGAAFFTSVLVLPVDNLKTRFQNIYQQ